AIHRGNADPKLLSYEYIRMLPQIAQSSSSKLWMIPSDLTSALDAVSKGFSQPGDSDDEEPANSTPKESRVRFPEKGEIAEALAATSLPDIDQALTDAKGEASKATDVATESGTQSGRHFDPGAESGQRPNLPDGI
ncbi:MAG: SPFH domain-containing protein, partial [Ancrocorticia sp.]